MYMDAFYGRHVLLDYMELFQAHHHTAKLGKKFLKWTEGIKKQFEQDSYELLIIKEKTD